MMKESHAYALAQVLTEPASELKEMLDTSNSFMRRGAYHQTIPRMSSLALSVRSRLDPLRPRFLTRSSEARTRC
jgi:hypothetical protein